MFTYLTRLDKIRCHCVIYIRAAAPFRLCCGLRSLWNSNGLRCFLPGALRLQEPYVWLINGRGKSGVGMRAQVHLPVHTAAELCSEELHGGPSNKAEVISAVTMYREAQPPSQTPSTGLRHPSFNHCRI